VKVALREIRPDDAAWLATWLPEVAAGAGHADFDLDEWIATDSVRIIVGNGTDAGVVGYRLHEPTRDAALLTMVAMPRDQARRGVGMAAAALIEGTLHDAGARVLYAPATATHGISMYFWIRLGYRPLPRTGWPCSRASVAWLSREI
jgi:hypothetical protein